MVGVSHCGLSSRLGAHSGGWWSVSGGRKPYNGYSIFDLKQQQHQGEEGITISKVETPFTRIVRALPLLLISVLAYQVWCLDDAVPVARDWLRIGKVIFEGEGREDVVILKRLFGGAWLDELLALESIFFLPAMYSLRPPAQEQLVSSLAESGVVLFIIWHGAVKQSQRSQGGWFHSAVPILFTLAGQIVGLGVALPVYLFLSYVSSSETSRLSREQVKTHDLAAIIMAITLGHYVPGAGMVFSSMERKQRWSFVWQLYPLWVAITFHSLSAVFSRLLRNREEDEEVSKCSKLRISVGLVAGLGCLVRGWQVASSQRGIADVFWPGVLPGELLPDFAAYCVELWKWDQLLVFGSFILGLAYSLRDMQEGNMVRLDWRWMSIGVLAGSFVAGPGFAAALLWLVKEEALLRQ